MRWDCRILGSFWDSGQSDAQLLQRYHHTTAVHNRINMYIFGGMGQQQQQEDNNNNNNNKQWQPTNEFLEYNLESGEYHLLNNDIVFESGDALPALAQHSMTLVGENQLYIYGGKTVQGNASNQLYRFDISNNHWYHLIQQSEEDDFIPPHRYGHSAVTIDDSAIYIFGGTDGTTYYSDLYILNTGINHDCILIEKY
jgi:N-acetylneuraminic acid mutarotase